MGKINEQIKNKRCSINVRINPEMKDKFTAKVKSENRKAADVLREYIEYYTLGYVQKKGIDKQTNSAKRFRLDENDALSFDRACADMSLNPSAVLRSLVSDWLKIKGYKVDKK